MPAVFVSYRRDDAEGEAGRLYNDLVAQFGEDSVFMDVAAIEVGRDFCKAIDESVATCGVLLAIIGRDWLDAKNSSGQRRLDDPFDFVRLETASALRRDIPVVPVLVQGARMPSADKLPEDLKELAYRNGVEVSHARWNSDVQLLFKALRPFAGEPHGAPAIPAARASPSVAEARSPAPQAPLEKAPQEPAFTKAPSASANAAPVSARMPMRIILASVAAFLAVSAVGGYMLQSSWKAEEQQRLEAQQKALADAAAAEKARAEQKTIADKAAADKAAAEQVLAEQRSVAKQAAADRAAAEQVLAEQKSVAKQAAVDKALADKVAADKAAAQALAEQKAVSDKAAAHRARADRAASDKAAQPSRAVVAPAPAQSAAAWPDKPIRVIVPAAAGGISDVVSRLLAEKLQPGRRQPLVLDNRPGARGSIGAAEVARSAPEDNIWLMGADWLVTVNPHMFKVLGFKVDDLLRVTIATKFGQALVCNPSVGVKTLSELIAKARATKLSYASRGIGTPGHLSMELLQSMAGFEMNHVPYRGQGPAVLNLIAGQVPCGLFDGTMVLSHVRAGKLLALAVTGAAR